MSNIELSSKLGTEVVAQLPSLTVTEFESVQGIQTDLAAIERRLAAL